MEERQIEDVLKKAFTAMAVVGSETYHHVMVMVRIFKAALNPSTFPIPIPWKVCEIPIIKLSFFRFHI